MYGFALILRPGEAVSYTHLDVYKRQALYRSTFGNPDLKWEKTLQWDAGVDVSVLNQRIDLSLDYYYKKTSDLLLEAPIPGTSGLNTIMRNIGSVQNQGFELTLNTHNIQTDNFNWMSTVLFNVNRNKILNLCENDEDIYPKPRHAQGDIPVSYTHLDVYKRQLLLYLLPP